MRLVKLVSYKFTTKYRTKWELGKTTKVEWSGQMCGDGCLHAYRSVELAALLRNLHCVDHYDVALLCECPEVLLDDGLKVGVAELTPIVRIEMPEPSPRDYVEFALRVALAATKLPQLHSFLDRWVKKEEIPRDQSLFNAGGLYERYLARSIWAMIDYAESGGYGQYTVYEFGSVLSHCRRLGGPIDFNLLAKETLCRK